MGTSLVGSLEELQRFVNALLRAHILLLEKLYDLVNLYLLFFLFNLRNTQLRALNIRLGRIAMASMLRQLPFQVKRRYLCRYLQRLLTDWLLVQNWRCFLLIEGGHHSDASRYQVLLILESSSKGILQCGGP
ncbi:hypothetical protein FGO68_gene3801 [Halteria grandinella]|uniref:Uncharacterized protein n=1 Tax=Halteria grandinella TaxID=5974 RepID=A0A8J8P1Z7_HALGN|nr:hypothetical protein FGO68_gene3801 [Halteria grandinella]